MLIQEVGQFFICMSHTLSINYNYSYELEIIDRLKQEL